MIFLDTCVWMELMGVRTPTQPHERRQAIEATRLFQKILKSDEIIVTCNEQLLELITAIQKVTMKTVNRERKEKNDPGVGNLKEFRTLSEFQKTKILCETVINDVKHFAEVENIGDYDLHDLIGRLDLADINDCLYYDYCVKKDIDFYTFDKDIKELGNSEKIHLI